jgi:hypothetical protein
VVEKKGLVHFLTEPILLLVLPDASHNPATAGFLTEHGWFEVTSVVVLIRSKTVLIFLF